MHQRFQTPTTFLRSHNYLTAEYNNEAFYIKFDFLIIRLSRILKESKNIGLGNGNIIQLLIE